MKKLNYKHKHKHKHKVTMFVNLPPKKTNENTGSTLLEDFYNSEVMRLKLHVTNLINAGLKACEDCDDFVNFLRENNPCDSFFDFDKKNEVDTLREIYNYYHAFNLSHFKVFD